MYIDLIGWERQREKIALESGGRFIRGGDTSLRKNRIEPFVSNSEAIDDLEEGEINGLLELLENALLSVSTG